MVVELALVRLCMASVDSTSSVSLLGIARAVVSVILVLAMLVRMVGETSRRWSLLLSAASVMVLALGVSDSGVDWRSGRLLVMATNSVSFAFQVIVRVTVASVIVVAIVFSVVTDVVTFGWPVRAVAVDSMSFCLRGIVRASAVIVVVLVLENIDSTPLSCLCRGLACVALPAAMVLTPSGESSSRLPQKCPVGYLTSHPSAVRLASVRSALGRYPLGGFHTYFGPSPLFH